MKRTELINRVKIISQYVGEMKGALNIITNQIEEILSELEVIED